MSGNVAHTHSEMVHVFSDCFHVLVLPESKLGRKSKE